ncbi:MAG: glucose dehydrogenase [Verrucomicrobia bacterium]|nr:MAG: glucose dehydrogenase [Verrucomicrobiota bacterium]
MKYPTHSPARATRAGLLAVFLLLAAALRATTLPPGFAEARLPHALSFPATIAVAPDGRVFVGERIGRLRIFKNDQLLPTPFVTLNVESAGERGLVGVALDPNFASNQYVYVYYTATTPTIHNRISRFTAGGDVAVPGSEVVLMDLDDLVADQHNGGTLRFGSDGMLYVASGDNYYSPNAQSLQTVKGKILRIRPDGTIPSDNPFYLATTGINRAIWALGLRNPYTFDIQPGTGRMFVNDVGDIKWEEINEGMAGANFGWPETEGPTADPRFEAPLLAYGHGPGDTSGCAVTGGAFYNPANPQFPASYLGKYLFIDYCNGWIRMLDPGDNSVVPFATGIGVPNTVQVAIAPDGALYYLTVADAQAVGGMFKITYTGSLAPQIGTQPVGKTVTVGNAASFSVTAYGSPTLGFQWQSGGLNIPGATSATYTTPPTTLADNGSQYRCVVTNALGTTTSAVAILAVTTKNAPVPTITQPLPGASYASLDVVSFAGQATDAEEGPMPPSALVWDVVFHHNGHSHPFMDPVGGMADGTFTVPDTGEVSTDVYFHVTLTATDSQGMSASSSVDVHPRLSQINLLTVPGGLQATLEGAPVTTPASSASVINMQRLIGAVTPQTNNNVVYDFVGWSDGGAAQHLVATPAVPTTYIATYQIRTNGTLSASPNPVTVTDGTGLGATTLTWTSTGTSAVEVHVNSPGGPLFSQSAAGAWMATTGKWVGDGTTFYLQNVSGGLPLVAANTLATATVNIRAGTIAANPNPVAVSDGSGLGATQLTWNTTGTANVEVHVGSPSGPLFSRSTAGGWTATTGKWVSNGMVFYLQDVTGGQPLTAANTLASVQVGVVNRGGSLAAAPNPIVVTDGTGLGATTLTWNTTGTALVEVRVGSPTGPLFSRSLTGAWTATTGKWVSNGMVFYLQDISGGLPLTAANTLATVQVGVVARSGSIAASPNPVTVTDGTGLGVTTLTWTSVGTKAVEVRVGSPSGSLFSRSGPGGWTATTGKWVGNGTVFYLQDVSGGLPLTAANTLGSVTVTIR